MKKVLLPEVTDFSVLFPVVAFTQDTAPAPRIRKITGGYQAIGPYCNINYKAVYVGMSDEVYQALCRPDGGLVEIVDDVVEFKCILHDDGTVSVWATYSKIIGSRLLCYVQANTVPIINGVVN